MSEERAALLARYRQLVLRDLPRLAREGHWVVTNDHCFGRIVLDATVGRMLVRRPRPPPLPAFEQLDDEALAVALAERMAAEGKPLVRDLDTRSLAWRGKPAKAPHSFT